MSHYHHPNNIGTQQTPGEILVSNAIRLNGCPWAPKDPGCPFKSTRSSLRPKQKRVTERQGGRASEWMNEWVRDREVVGGRWREGDGEWGAGQSVGKPNSPRPHSPQQYTHLHPATHTHTLPLDPATETTLRLCRFHHSSYLSSETLSRPANGDGTEFLFENPYVINSAGSPGLLIPFKDMHRHYSAAEPRLLSLLSDLISLACIQMMIEGLLLNPPVFGVFG